MAGGAPRKKKSPTTHRLGLGTWKGCLRMCDSLARLLRIPEELMEELGALCLVSPGLTASCVSKLPRHGGDGRSGSCPQPELRRARGLKLRAVFCWVAVFVGGGTGARTPSHRPGEMGAGSRPARDRWACGDGRHGWLSLDCAESEQELKNLRGERERVCQSRWGRGQAGPGRPWHADGGVLGVAGRSRRCSRGGLQQYSGRTQGRRG